MPTDLDVASQRTLIRGCEQLAERALEGRVGLGMR
jgi:hypothetical protein